MYLNSYWKTRTSCLSSEARVPRCGLHYIIFKRQQKGEKIKVRARTGQKIRRQPTTCSDLSSILAAALSSSSATHPHQGSDPNEHGSHSIRCLYREMRDRKPVNRFADSDFDNRGLRVVEPKSQVPASDWKGDTDSDSDRSSSRATTGAATVVRIQRWRECRGSSDRCIGLSSTSLAAGARALDRAPYQPPPFWR